MDLDTALNKILSKGFNHVIKLQHPWLHVFAQNLAGRPALVIGLAEPPDYFIDGGRGFTTEVGVGTGRLQNFIRIASNETFVQPAFVALCRHLLEQSRGAMDTPASVFAFYAALEEFRNFLGKPLGRLGEAAIRGLMAELLILRGLLEAGGDQTAVMRAWNGPFGNSKDFIFSSGHCVEVKSAHRPTMQVTISSLQQLEAPNVTLQLAVVPMEQAQPENPDAQSFIGLIESVRALVSAQPPAERLWDTAIDTIGLDQTDPFYAGWWFIMGEILAFDVVDGFPTIESKSVPPGITGVTYHLNVTTLEPFSAPLRLN